MEKAGGKRTIECNTYWCTDQWLFAGVEEFPNIEAVQKEHSTRPRQMIEGCSLFYQKARGGAKLLALSDHS
jgi:hypothetical protein